MVLEAEEPRLYCTSFYVEQDISVMGREGDVDIPTWSVTRSVKVVDGGAYGDRSYKSESERVNFFLAGCPYHSPSFIFRYSRTTYSFITLLNPSEQLLPLQGVGSRLIITVHVV